MGHCGPTYGDVYSLVGVKRGRFARGSMCVGFAGKQSFEKRGATVGRW